MVVLAGYTDLIQIYEGTNSQVYRAQRLDNNQSVILKFLNEEYPSTEQIRRYKQEYHLTCQLDSPGIIKAYSLEEYQRSYALALEDFGGISLKQWLEEGPELSVEEFLFLAIAITESLGQIHTQHIIHKDINPSNIVFNPETKELKIIDFGIATQLSRENPTLKNPNVLEGTLPYISPEQTGRMNRGLDYRTDFYSLGITFYEMLSGKLPFESSDTLELVHCHLAKNPPAIIREEKLNKIEIPQIIADIVMKLMAKNAEDRYQSADGLKADLEECRRQLKGIGNINSFILGQQDISDRLQIPQKLYGREEEIVTLLAAFERVAETGKVEFMMVTGYSGIGKSSLVQELYKPITVCRGYFISGKFDQFQHNIPYSAILGAFRGLIGQLLVESRDRLERWRKKLLKALGCYGQIIIDVIPEVELIIGKQPPVPVLGVNESQNRFNLIFGNLIRVFSNNNHPLTIFLDDLQWADLASLTLIEQILFAEKTEYLLLVGAYRNNEVDVGHPLLNSLERIKEKYKEIQEITLQPLSQKEIVSLIGETFNQIQGTHYLAELVWQKTGGNPFFINEFLQALSTEKLLQFDHQSRTWQWKIEEIEARGFSDNVVEMMVEKLQKLPQSSQEILSMAAFWGAEFDLEIISLITQKSPQEIFEYLKIAMERNLIVPKSELDENLLIQSYQFSHDRIQQAAYALIPEWRKAITHYYIGQVILEKISPGAIEESIFQLVNQLNYGITLIREQKERDELAKLNLTACHKAKATSGYQVSREYAKIGLELLGENAWHRQYEMTLLFYNNSAELAWLCGDFEEMERFIHTVITEGRSLLDRVNVCLISIKSKVTQTKLKEAIEIALEYLQQLGFQLPQSPTPKDTQKITAEISQLIGNSNISDLVDLPVAVDATKASAIQITNSIIPAAYFSNFLLYPLLISFSVKLSIENGNIPASAVAYVCYSIVACNILLDVETGVAFGDLALKLVSKLDAKAFKPEVLNVVGLFTLHRKSHTKETLPLLQESYAGSMGVGNLEAAGYSAHNFCLNAFWCGLPLENLEQQVRTYYQKLVRLNQLMAANLCQIHLQSILNLQAAVDHPYILSGEVFLEAEFLEQLQAANNFSGLSYLYLYKLMLCYLFGEITLAKNYAVEIKQYLKAVVGTVAIPALYLYDSLTFLADATPDSEDLPEVLAAVEENQRQLQQYWAKYAPMNHQHKVDLVEAEKCRILGQKAEAIELYNKAISGAEENEYIQEEALANELAAKFYLDWKQEKIALVYMRDAHYCYYRWGATAKIKHLEDKYAKLFKFPTATTYGYKILSTRTTNNYSTTAEFDLATLDLATLIKSTNAISSEIVLNKLLATLMDIMVENAGARRGILILPDGEGLFVEATKEYSQEVCLLQPIPVNKFKQLSKKIVNYVARTGKTVVLNDAMGEDKSLSSPSLASDTDADDRSLTDDAYIQKYQCHSIACTPLINRGQLQGIIYLENNLTTGAFTRERLALLRTLAAQAAISLENARLYDACKRFVPEQFLSFLEKKSIVNVKLGDQVEREMTVLFSDIRDFTTISEKMTPAENFAFINEYLGYMEPLIQKHSGFIDKYIGDAIMALFPNSADDAVKGAIAMLEELKMYNSERQQRNLKPIRIGIGLHTGRLMLGTVGGFGRMDGTAIGDAVNLSSRVERFTKTYGVSLLITHKTLVHLNNPLEYNYRFIEQVTAKGKTKSVALFEVFSADPPELRDIKIATKQKFEKAVLLFYQGAFTKAAALFQECLEYGDRGRVVYRYLERCRDSNIMSG
ncbi:MAG: AAA family ATPase [Okeania sp. SIO3B5]|uniref:protein kinase domain-containing protein n=1 Tax=Okeania sp. SIO3B5 TaxID=2607811 RepID=UPI0014009916|nr:AAA family ATPase [Okeania sp. SIO3B5]NEO55778.1 AAA family ATPase [Okeania sp. SIO3B5]